MNAGHGEQKITRDDQLGRIDYKQEFGPPPMSFDEYAPSASAAYARLISNDPSEAVVQEFLEQNPSFVPGAWTPGGNSGHPPWNQFLVTQPVLPGLSTRRPDFMWIAQHSDTWFPTFIEIESPTKRLFRADGQPTSDFTQARTQISEWKAWFEAPANAMKFILVYGLSSQFVNRRMQPTFILVLGRRAEFADHGARTRVRAVLMGENEELISFDRLLPAPQLEDVVTVVSGRDGKWRARSVAPTFGLVPPGADRLLVLEGLEETIRRTEGITGERAEFLSKRIAYWRTWAARPNAPRVYGPWKRE